MAFGKFVKRAKKTATRAARTTGKVVTTAGKVARVGGQVAANAGRVGQVIGAAPPAQRDTKKTSRTCCAKTARSAAMISR